MAGKRKKGNKNSESHTTSVVQEVLHDPTVSTLLEHNETIIAEVIVGTYQEFLLGYQLIKKSTEEGEEKFRFKQSFTNHSHCGSIRAISTIGKYIVSGSTDEVLRIINLTTRTEHGSLQQQNGTITCLANYESSHLLSGSDDGTLCVWRSGNWQCEKTLKGHPSGVLGVAVHPTGKLALSIAKDKSLRTWNLIKGRCGYVTNLKAIADVVVWSPKGTMYAIGISNRVDVYAVETAQVVYSVSFGKRITSIRFAREKTMFVAGDQEEIEVHDLDTQKKILSFPTHKCRVKDMQFFSNPRSLITASNDGFIKIWDFRKKFSNPPTLLAEVNTSCRITCLTVWKPDLLESEATSDGTKANEAKNVKMKREVPEEESTTDTTSKIPAKKKKKHETSISVGK